MNDKQETRVELESFPRYAIRVTDATVKGKPAYVGFGTKRAPATLVGIEDARLLHTVDAATEMYRQLSLLCSEAVPAARYKVVPVIKGCRSWSATGA